jgi:hypothetical protein
MEPRGLERFTGRQLGFDCAWRCRAQGAPDWNLRPPPSGVLLGGLSSPAGAVSLIYSTLAVQSSGRGGPRDCWLPLAMVLTAVAVAIVGRRGVAR